MFTRSVYAMPSKILFKADSAYFYCSKKHNMLRNFQGAGMETKPVRCHVEFFLSFTGGLMMGQKKKEISQPDNSYQVSLMASLKETVHVILIMCPSV